MQPCGWSGGTSYMDLVGILSPGLQPHRGGDQVASRRAGTPVPPTSRPTPGGQQVLDDDSFQRMYCLEHVGRGPDGFPRLPLRSHKHDLSCTHSVGIQIEACLLWLVFLDQACALPGPYMSRLQGAHITLSPVWSCRRKLS